MLKAYNAPKIVSQKAIVFETKISGGGGCSTGHHGGHHGGHGGNGHHDS